MKRDDRDMWNAVLGFFAGFVASALMLAVIYLVR